MVESESHASAVTAVLSLYPGDTLVRAQIADKHKPYLRNFRQRVTPCDELFERLRNLVGDKGVIYREKA